MNKKKDARRSGALIRRTNDVTKYSAVASTDPVAKLKLERAKSDIEGLKKKLGISKTQE